MARLLQCLPAATLGDLNEGEENDDDEAFSPSPSSSDEAGGARGGFSSLAAAVLPLARRHGLTRAELVLRVRGWVGACHCIWID